MQLTINEIFSVVSVIVQAVVPSQYMSLYMAYFIKKHMKCATSLPDATLVLVDMHIYHTHIIETHNEHLST